MAKGSYTSIVVWGRNHPQTVGIFLLLSALLVVALVRLQQFSINSAPPGSDGGQWLAFGHQLFNGEQIKAGFQYYPPLFPFLVRVIALNDGLLTLKLLGIIASVLVCVPIYLLLRTALHPWAAAIVSVAPALTPYKTEVLNFGGYPQLLGTSFLILTLFLLLNGLNTGRRIWFMGAAVAAAATANSNVLPALVLAISSVLVLLMWSYRLWQKGGPVLYARLRYAVLWWIVPSVILCVPLFGTYLAYLSPDTGRLGNPQELSLLDIAHSLGSAWLLEFVLWSSIFFIAVVSLALNRRVVLAGGPVLVTATTVVLASGSIGLLIFRELRFGEYIEIGLVLLIGLLLNMLGSFLSVTPVKRYLLPITLTVAIVVVSVIGVIGYRRFIIAYNWYNVVDASVLPAMEWLRDNRIPGAKVAATGALRGNNYGWWIEGYAHMPTYMAGDTFLFFHSEEHAQVELAWRLVMEDSPPTEIGAISDEESIRYLFLDKHVLQRPLGHFIQAGFINRFENETIVIMERDAGQSR
ncbi:MAG: hypothetical protein QF713_02700 [Dehalococcoidales bacterium]|nr:hypothetical protein [Dehalococcoidales bacterium]